MAILKIARLGHPALRQRCQPLSLAEIADPAVQQLIDDMLETVEEEDGAGLAAPQVHASVRIVVLSLEPEQGLQVWINPELTPQTDEHLITYEGCLSVPGLRGAVARPARLLVRALDRSGEPIEVELEGFPAVVAQHECDHLDGILYVDRLEPGTLMFLTEYRRYGPWPLHALAESEGLYEDEE